MNLDLALLAILAIILITSSEFNGSLPQQQITTDQYILLEYL